MAAASYDYDLIVVGGGSGGLAAAKKAAQVNPSAKIACFDYIVPTPQGTAWGLGGTCVNVGCIPKKLFHYSSVMRHKLRDATALGWQEVDNRKHHWKQMVGAVDGYIMSLNYNYKSALMENKVTYINAYARFVNDHTVEYKEEAKGNQATKTVTAAHFIIAAGGRPTYPNIPGAKEFGITSDDIFWWKKNPGKTLLVGGSYIALECASFLAGLGHDVTVMVRSILLRGFDQQCAEQVGEYMERNGVKFVQPCTPTKLERTAPEGPIAVSYTNNEEKKSYTEEYDTVLFAIGRHAQVDALGLDLAGVRTNDKGKIIVDPREQTSVPHIFCIGDVAQGRPELTPAAIQAGERLAVRLMTPEANMPPMDYKLIPTTVFTAVEMGTVGLSEEEAIATLGADKVVAYASRFGVVEGAVFEHDTLPEQTSTRFTMKNLFARKQILRCGGEWKDYGPIEFETEERRRAYMKQPYLAKLVCDKTQNDRVIGLHYVGPEAGEVLQGFALAVKLGATKADFDDLVGIHPTGAEEFTILKATTTDKEGFMKKGGC